MLVRLVVVLEVREQLDLVERLVKEVLVVLDDLNAHHLARVKVEALHCLGEGGGSQVLLHLVPRGDQRVDADREVLVLLEASAPALVHYLEVHRVILPHLGLRSLVRIDVGIALKDVLLPFFFTLFPHFINDRLLICVGSAFHCRPLQTTLVLSLTLHTLLTQILLAKLLSLCYLQLFIRRSTRRTFRRRGQRQGWRLTALFGRRHHHHLAIWHRYGDVRRLILGRHRAPLCVCVRLCTAIQCRD
mmetsp:Transcript_27575/g.68551  ORF Transcript_27575/g.68551 Transcript_27575/m.68551 type:complete len:245 (-) Transcript_27575:283-1017(-)